MSNAQDAPPYQRNALFPGFIALVMLIVGVAFVGTGWFTIFLFLVTILALIVAWFAAQARQWWWVPTFIAIAVLWNPAFPFPFGGIFWILAQPLAASTFFLAGALIKIPRD